MGYFGKLFRRFGVTHGFLLEPSPTGLLAMETLCDPPFGSPPILGSFGESFHGFSEEARTRGFPSPPFGGFGYMVATTKLSTKEQVVQLGNDLE